MVIQKHALPIVVAHSTIVPSMKFHRQFSTRFRPLRLLSHSLRQTLSFFFCKDVNDDSFLATLEYNGLGFFLRWL